MADLELNVDANIKEVANDVRGLNNELDETTGKTGKAARGAKTMGDNMATAFKAFAVGGAIQRGFSVLKDDISEIQESSLAVVRNLKEIDFLKGEVGKQAVRDIAKSLNMPIADVAAVAGPVFSANPNMSMQQLKSVVSNALIEQQVSNAPALDIASGTSGLVNSSTTFKDNGAGDVGAQNFILKTTEQTNMATKDIGLLAPMFATASIVGISPFEVSAAFELVVKNNIKPAEAVTMIKTLMIQWSIYGKPEGMSLIQFVMYAVAIADPKMRNTVIPGASAGIAAGSISPSGVETFNAGVAKFKKAGENRKSSSVARYNEKVKNNPEFRGSQLDTAIDSIMVNRQSDPNTIEKNSVFRSFFKGVFEEAMFSFTGFSEGLTLNTVDLGSDVHRETSKQLREASQGRGLEISLDNISKVTSKLDASITSEGNSKLP